MDTRPARGAKMTRMRRSVIYFVLAAIAGLIGGVGLAGELSAHVTRVDGLVVGTHKGSTRGANGGSTTTYYVDVEREDTFERDSVRNARFYEAYRAAQDPHVTLEIRTTGPDVERIASVRYLGHTYEATTKAEAVGVAIAFLVLTALFVVLGVRRAVKVRRARLPVATPTWGPPGQP